MLMKNLSKMLLVSGLLIILIFSSSVRAGRFNMSYLYGNYNYSNLVTRTGNSLNEVSPSYFDLNLDGTLKLNTVDKQFVSEMHSKGIKVVPFLSNHWNKTRGKKALNNVEKLTSQIVEAINTYNLDGVNVDIENVTESERESYTNFVKRLREKLGNNKIVSVAVAANPYNWQTGWHGSYDYAGLAKYADYLMIMAYDEHYEGGTAGPVASIEFVEKSIQYALTKVDASKIVLGIPFFGRYWQDNESYGGYGISLNTVENLKKYKYTYSYDENSQSPKMVVKILTADSKPKVNGKTWYSGTYTIWYENEKSISAKLDLVNKYNLKGTGSWSLGQETSDTWGYYTNKLNEGLSLNEQPTIEIETEQIPSFWAEDSIEHVRKNGWMKGRTENDFYPKDSLTRAEFATILVRVLELDENAPQEYDYLDTRGHWAEKYISYVTVCGYMQGYGNGIFKPDKGITREEIAKVLANIKIEKNIEIAQNISFIDMDSSNWSYDEVIQIARYGILKGYDDGTFRPKKEISREEMAVILARAF